MIGDKFRLMIARGVLKLVGDAKKLQAVQMQVLADELKNDAEHFQHYGFTSVPFPGAEGIVLFIGGNRSHPVVLGLDDRRYRKRDMEAGEVALYTDEGDYVHFKRGRIVEVKAGEQCVVDAPLATFKGDLHVEGSITCDNQVSDANGSMQEMRDTYNAHNHGGAGPTPAMS